MTNSTLLQKEQVILNLSNRKQDQSLLGMKIK